MLFTTDDVILITNSHPLKDYNATNSWNKNLQTDFKQMKKCIPSTEHHIY